MGSIPVNPVTPYSYTPPPDLFANTMVNAFNASTSRQNADTSARSQDLQEYIAPQEIALKNRQVALSEQIEPQRIALQGRQVDISDRAQKAQESQFAQELPLDQRRVAIGERQATVAEGDLKLRRDDFTQFGDRKMAVDELRANDDSRRTDLAARINSENERYRPAEERRANAQALSQLGYAVKGLSMEADTRRIATQTMSDTLSGINSEVRASRNTKGAQAADAATQSASLELSTRQAHEDATIRSQLALLRLHPAYSSDPRYVGDVLMSLKQTAPQAIQRNSDFINQMTTEILDSPSIHLTPDLRNQMLALNQQTETPGGLGTTYKNLRKSITDYASVIAGSGPDGVGSADLPAQDPALILRLGKVGKTVEELAKAPYTEQLDKDGNTKSFTFHFDSGDVALPTTSPAFGTVAKLAFEGVKARQAGIAPPLPDVPATTAAGKTGIPNPNVPAPAIGEQPGLANDINTFGRELAAPFKVVGGALAATGISAFGYNSPQSRVYNTQSRLAENFPASFGGVAQGGEDPEFSQQINSFVTQVNAPQASLPALDSTINQLASTIATREQAAGSDFAQIPTSVKENIRARYGVAPADIAAGERDYLRQLATQKIIRSMPIDKQLIYSAVKNGGWLGMLDDITNY